MGRRTEFKLAKFAPDVKDKFPSSVIGQWWCISESFSFVEIPDQNISRSDGFATGTTSLFLCHARILSLSKDQAGIPNCTTTDRLRYLLFEQMFDTFDLWRFDGQLAAT